jgi:phage shock protein PspC (stress-responsive transcriptional regulator)
MLTGVLIGIASAYGFSSLLVAIWVALDVPGSKIYDGQQ